MPKTDSQTTTSRRVCAAMALLDQRAEGSQCGTMIAEMLSAADAVLLGSLRGSLVHDENGVQWVSLDVLKEAFHV